MILLYILLGIAIVYYTYTLILKAQPKPVDNSFKPALTFKDSGMDLIVKACVDIASRDIMKIPNEDTIFTDDYFRPSLEKVLFHVLKRHIKQNGTFESDESLKVDVKDIVTNYKYQVLRAQKSEK